MTIIKAHDYAHYTHRHAAWRQGAAASFTPQWQALQTLPHKPDKHVVIGGVNVTMRVYSDEKHAKEKIAAVTEGIAQIQQVYPNIVIPDLEFHLLRAKQVDWPQAPSGSIKITCVAHHVDQHANDHARIFLTDACLEGVAAAKPSLTSGGLFISKDSRAFHHEYGPMGSVRGIADYLWEMVPRKKDSTRIRAVVVHEVGHVLHQSINPNAFWALNCAPGDFNQTDMPKKAISTYGQSCPVEWVAEAFTAKISGFHITTAIARDYTTFGGPE